MAAWTVPGLGSEPVKVAPGSAYVDRPLGHTRARTRTGASVVAIVRGEDVIASPGPDQVLRPADVLVVVGTREGIDRRHRHPGAGRRCPSTCTPRQRWARSWSA
ncbi:cation:proton antiporter regulatory subunit [Nonomuraea glycinis]|uniref:cation:proton antiporter regulatory subunit n=1 Tax=Nonomuraea glycinis TaxID=2047744 RepID=UPI002E0FADBB|nr:hypothetical protein OHA68_28540 [Nonomuraea glycinis]